MAKVKKFTNVAAVYVGDKKAALAAIKKFKLENSGTQITETSGIVLRHHIEDRQRINDFPACTAGALLEIGPRMRQVPPAQHILDAVQLVARKGRRTERLMTICWFENPAKITAASIAAKLARLSGIEITGDDYKTWFDGKGKGDGRLFQKAVNKIVLRSEWEALEAAALTDPGLQYRLFGGVTQYEARVNRQVRAVLAHA